MDMEVKVFPYVVRFTIAYAVALVALAITTTLLDIESSTPSSIGALIAGVIVAVSRFVKDHERVPSSGERKRLTVASLLASFLVSAALLLVFLGVSGQSNQLAGLMELLNQLSVGLAVAVFLFVFALYALALWWFYGSIAKWQYRSLARAKNEI